MKTIKCGSYHCKGGHKWINRPDGPRLNPMVCGSGLSREFVERKLKELEKYNPPSLGLNFKGV